MEKPIKWIIILIISIVSVISIMFILFEPVITKLERSCNEFDMNYVFREGTNCLDKNNVLHPIESNCSIWRVNKLCEIRFIQSPT